MILPGWLRGTSTLADQLDSSVPNKNQSWRAGICVREKYMVRLLMTSALVMAMAMASSPQNSPAQQIQLPTSKLLQDRPGRVGFINSFPSAIALSPDGKYAAVLNDGYGTQGSRGRQSISVLDLGSDKLRDFPDSRFSTEAHQSYFLGMAFSTDGRSLYVSVVSLTDPTGAKRGDLGNGIAVYKFVNGKIRKQRFIKIPPQPVAAGKTVAPGLSGTPAGTAIPYPAGLSVISVGGHDQLLVANDLSDNVVLLDASDRRILKSFDLSTHDSIPSSFPYAVVASRDGRHAWCTLWNSSKIAGLDLASGKVRWVPLLEPKSATDPGSHPTALMLSPDERLLYVTLSNADAIAVVDAASGEVIHLASTKIAHQQYAGSYPNALAQSADGKRIFVADASLNAVAVFDAATLAKHGTGSPAADEALGFIPADWYPSAVASSGESLLVAAAKGRSTGPNSGAGSLKSEKKHREHPYIATLLYGSLSKLNFLAAENNLPRLTQEVQHSNLLSSDGGKIEFRAGQNPIRHVIYILKENRTYDQILGDLKAEGRPVGNGDASLTMYGEDITPNEHKLARQFGVLDNFYDSGEVSGDGHVWSSAAITSDYNEKTWQIAYRGKEHTYDYGGSVADEIPLELGKPLVDAPASGYIWDNLARNGLTYRDYGEYVAGVWCTPEKKRRTSPTEGTPSPFSETCARSTAAKGEPLPANVGDPRGGASPWPWAVPLLKTVRPTLASLREHFDPAYPDFNTEYPDQLRADEFLREFDQFVQARNNRQGAELPQFVLLYLPNDHTHGTAAGKPRPAASVADNDLAVGRVVEAVSHSPYWDDTAIFIIEDDAQDGADHVDAHRSIAFEISKYSPGSREHPFVDSRFYTTVNMVRTMEILLGLPPMNQNDAYAPAMAALFSGSGDQSPFTADWRNRDNGLIYQMNGAKAPGAKQSAKMNFAKPDAINASLLNRVLWRDRMGKTRPPSPEHSVFPANRAPADDK
jgi:DNA-binding beta-propeller fold protein YncE